MKDSRSITRDARDTSFLLAVIILLSTATPSVAHGFGARYTLPVPLWLYGIGAAATVALSFVLIALCMRHTPRVQGAPRLNLLHWRLGRLLLCPAALCIYRGISVSLLALVVLAGFVGTQQAGANLAPTLVWVMWWVGLAYISALGGNIWVIINPWSTLFDWAEALYRHRDPQRQLSRRLPYPQRFGVWPGVLLFGAFAWVEHVFSGRAVPAYLAVLAIEYSLITWLGMFCFGRDIWLRHGEAFVIAFALLARFAPTACRMADGAAPTVQAWYLRPFAVGLLQPRHVSTSMMVFVLLLLSTVTFDGFTETPAWWRLTQILYDQVIPEVGIDHLTLTDTVSLNGFVALCCGLYLLCCRLMASMSGNIVRTGALARAFALSLVPIALAYHLAHYLSFFLVQGQLIIPLASDPWGRGWNLLGTAAYEINTTIIGNRLVWFLSVGAIVLGHIIAVYLAHVAAWRIFPSRQLALRSQYPMLLLMLGYTMVSLWILAQPVVENPALG